ncbi:unnamed protein product [Moneuplotes crassus]|uniref:Uncharacterized protein n=1 Tax=Euplotes crassus TaxID=5936 RepID=A0AAD2D4S1_EUPCR|nr:unnamed protein product [Moneuplotes crassus]
MKSPAQDSKPQKPLQNAPFTRLPTSETLQPTPNPDSDCEEFLGPPERQTNTLCKLIEQLHITQHETASSEEEPKVTKEKGNRCFLNELARLEVIRKQKDLGFKSMCKSNLNGLGKKSEEAGIAERSGDSEPLNRKMSNNYKAILLDKLLEFSLDSTEKLPENPTTLVCKVPDTEPRELGKRCSRKQRDFDY